MKRFLIALMVMFMGVSVISTVDTYAYEKAEDGVYYVDSDASKTVDNIVTLYILYPSNNFLSGTLYYKFYSTTLENFKNNVNAYAKMLPLQYVARLETAKYIKDSNGENLKIGDGILLSYTFNLENGTYIFASNDFAYYETLAPDYSCPADIPLNMEAIVKGDESSIVSYPVELTGGYYDIYTIYGSNSFIVNNDNKLSEYVKTHKKEMANNGADVSEKETVDEKDLADKWNELTGEDKDKVNLEENQSLGTNESDNTIVTITPPEDNNTENGDTEAEEPINYLIIIGGVLGIIAVFYIFRKK